MAALMTSDMRSTDRLAIEMSECAYEFDVLGPDINQSYADFAIVGGENKIRFGLAAIKGMGKALVEDIVIPERDKNGPFQSVCDFAKRVDSTKFNKKSWESAIKTGAFDRFGTRSDLLLTLSRFKPMVQKCKKIVLTDRPIFWYDGRYWPSSRARNSQSTEASFPIKSSFSSGSATSWGSISAHPLDKYEKYFEEQTHPFSYINQEHDNKRITLGGIVTMLKL